MNALKALSLLRALKLGVFQTSDAAALFKTSPGTASKILGRLQENQGVVRVARGRWVIPEQVDRLAIPEHLTAPWPSYVSLQTALFYHGMISQIPAVTYAVSLSRTKQFKTPIGVYSIHQLGPDFFFGYETTGKSGIKLATPEKALLDFLYLGLARSKLFTRLPELELPARFNVRRAREMIGKIRSERRRAWVKRRFEELLDLARS